MVSRLLAILMLVSTGAQAHQAPTGWSYDAGCCSNKDCREIADSDIEETPQGYLVKFIDELILYTDVRIHQSKDEHFHWCENSSKKTRCLYVPNRGSVMIDLKQEELDDAIHTGYYVSSEPVGKAIWDFFTPERFPKHRPTELKKLRNELIDLLGDKMFDAYFNHIGEDRHSAVMKRLEKKEVPS